MFEAVRLSQRPCLTKSAARTSALMLVEAYHRHGVDPEGLVLHSDNGGPMKGSTMLATLQRLAACRTIKGLAASGSASLWLTGRPVMEAARLCLARKSLGNEY
jgi:hypothetical protein